jgi:5-methylcytosine-specific restriction endonuclease McrA
MKRPERFKLCAEPRCPEIVPAGQSRCDQHGKTNWDRWRRSDPQRSQGYGASWRRARQAALDAAAHRCEVCGSTDRLEVHHIDGRTPLDPGANALSNLQVLCLRHHRLAEVERRRQQQQ